MKTIIPKITAVFLVASMLLFAACSKNETPPPSQPKEEKEEEVTPKDKVLYAVKRTTKENDTQTVVYNYTYEYDSLGRLSIVHWKEENIRFLSFTYDAEGRVSKMRQMHPVEYNYFIDYSLSYADNSKVPTRMTYSGAIPVYTTDVLYENGTLLWNDEDGREYSINDADFEKNTFHSFVWPDVTFTLHYDKSLKNGLEAQAVLNIPTIMNQVMIYFFIPILSSYTVIGVETSQGLVVYFQTEKDEQGYITKLVQGSSTFEFTYQ